jgi:hypothetical protein
MANITNSLCLGFSFDDLEVLQSVAQKLAVCTGNDHRERLEHEVTVAMGAVQTTDPVA